MVMESKFCVDKPVLRLHSLNIWHLKFLKGEGVWDPVQVHLGQKLPSYLFKTDI